jgi:MFS transporter, ACS family, hexuronate transporter
MTHDAVLSRRRCWFLLTLLFLASSLAFLDRQVLSVLAPTIMEEFGMSNTRYSQVVFAFVLTYTIMFGLGGRVLDAMGTRLGLAVSVGVWSLASMLHALVTGVWSLGAARCLLGVGEGPCIPGVVKGAVDWSPPKLRALAIGFANAGSAFGSLIAAPLSVWCAVWFGWRGAFALVGLLGFVWLVVWCFAVRGLPTASPAPSQRPRGSLGGLLQGAPVQCLLIARFCFDPVFYFYMFWIPQYFATERGMSMETIGSLVWMPFFALGVANIIAGRVSDMVVGYGRTPRSARMLLMLVAAAITPVSWFASLVDSPGLAVGFMSLLMFAHGIWIANYIALISDTVEPQQVGTAVGLSGTCGGIAGMLSGLVIGPVIDRCSFGPVFFVSALLYPLAWLVIFAGLKRTQAVD